MPAARHTFAGLEYRNIGPSRGGRVTTVTSVASQPSTFYMGSVGGGVWKTTDYGHNWVNISGQYLETGSMGAINVADSDPNNIYAGTGSDGMRAQVVTGRGMYKQPQRDLCHHVACGAEAVDHHQRRHGRRRLQVPRRRRHVDTADQQTSAGVER